MIRLLEEKDIEIVCGIVNDNWKTFTQGVGDTADTDMDGAFEIWRIYVDAQFQGNGIGKLLFEYAEQQAKQQGYKNCHNDTSDELKVLICKNQ